MNNPNKQFKKAYTQVSAPQELRRKVLMQIASEAEASQQNWFLHVITGVVPRIALPVGALVILFAVVVGINSGKDNAVVSLGALNEDARIFEDSVPELPDSHLAVGGALPETERAGGIDGTPSLAVPAEAPVAPDTLLADDSEGSYFDEEYESERYDLMLADL